jgi:hypothetical protein
MVNKDDSSNQPPTLERVDLTGRRELLFPTDKLGSPFSGYFLSTPDGTQLIFAVPDCDRSLAPSALVRLSTGILI